MGFLKFVGSYSIRVNLVGSFGGNVFIWLGSFFIKRVGVVGG